jgi:predicted O-linked N-acetylglucosamine transferase (SPINDLY family)
MSAAEPQEALRQAQSQFARGEFAAAFESASRVLVLAPQSQEARALRVNAALKLERWREAISDLGRLIATQPNQAKLRRILSVCWMRVGNADKARGQFDGAERAYRKSLAADAANHDAGYNLGVLLFETGRAHAAVEPLRMAANADPADVGVALKFADVLLAAKNNVAAMAQLEHVVGLGGTREQQRHGSRLLLEASSRDVAIARTRRFIEQKPAARSWAREFCRQLRKDGDLAGSRELLGLLRSHAQDDSERLRIDIADALGLPATYTSRDEMDSVRAEYLWRLDGLVTSYPPQRVAAIAPPPEALLWDNFHLAYQGGNDREPQTRFGHWLAASIQALLPFAAPARAARTRTCPRLAMVSSRFHDCTVGSYFASWVEHLATKGWDLILVHVGGYRDALTERLASSAHGEATLDADVADNAKKLHALGADVILYPELGMDSRVLGLASQRIAPVQVCAWGHPVTTGLPTIDAFLSCAQMEPADAHDHYSERLIGLPGLGTRYLSPALPEPASRATLGLPENKILYFVPQSLFKLHPDNDGIFVDIARRDRDAVFVFFASREPGAQRMFVDRLHRAFRASDIEFPSRWVFEPLRSRADYLRVNQACDIMLDTLHWSGGNTSLDALHAGLPIVTSPGRFMRGRQSMAMLKRLACDDLIVDSPQALAACAVEIAHDRTLRAAFAGRIRQNLADFVADEAPLHALDAALKALAMESL